MGMLDDLTEALTGSSSKRRASGDNSGKGGRMRKARQDEMIDEASGAPPAPPANATTPSNSGRQAQSTDAYNGY